MTAEYATGGEETFLSRYQLHDAAEGALAATFRGLGCEVERVGFDPHGDGGRVARQRERATADPDFRVEGLPIEVKATKCGEYLGNVARNQWVKYAPRTWFACFHVEGGEIRDAGAFRKDRVTVEGENETPFGEVYVEPRPVGSIFDLFRAVAAAKRGGGR